MKRIFPLLLALGILLAMAGCTVEPNDPLQTPSDISGSSKPSTNPTQTTTEATTPSTQNATVTETVLVDEAGIKITAKSLGDSLFGPELKLLFENNSGKDLTFQARNASINGYMAEPMLSVDVANGKKANDAMTFMSSQLEDCGITSIAEMEFSFHIFTTEDWKDYLNTSLLQIKTSIADTYQQPHDDSGKLAYEGNGVKIIVKGLDTSDSIMGPAIVLYIQNTGGKDVTVQTRFVSINGFMVEPIFSCDIGAGKRAVDDITFLSSELEENDITDITSVELSFHVFDSNTWDTIEDTAAITITF